MVTRYNISKPRKYISSTGEEKTYWDKVGELVEIEKDGKVSRIVKIPAIGLEANAFLDTPRGESAQGGALGQGQPSAPAPAQSQGEVNPEDIPF